MAATVSPPCAALAAADSASCLGSGATDGDDARAASAAAGAARGSPRARCAAPAASADCSDSAAEAPKGAHSQQEAPVAPAVASVGDALAHHAVLVAHVLAQHPALQARARRRCAAPCSQGPEGLRAPCAAFACA